MLTTQTLIDDLASGCKPKDQWRIGLEIERFAFNRATGTPLPYDGKPGIKQLLDAFAADHGWNSISENRKPIALKKDGMIVSLEPGGQVEYSGSPVATLALAQAEMDNFYKTLDETAAKLGIDLLAAGCHPSWTRDDVQWMPKERYRIMRPYMEKQGNLGIDMMGRTCGAQINLDYASENDMVRKFRVALAIQPVVTALMASSPAHGYASYRSHIWTDTDPDRCGVLPFVFDSDMDFERYVEYALDVPMYFIKRNGKYINVTGQSFRAFMNGKLPGHEGELPTMQDWQDHLTTLFPEVRLKHYLELRGADSNTPEMIMAMAAFWAGIFYDANALNAAWDLVKSWGVTDHRKIRDMMPRTGLATPAPDGRDLCALANDTLCFAENGLATNDRPFLQPFHEKVMGCTKHYAMA